MKYYGGNITWIITTQTVGQVSAYDLAFQSINSEYILICEDNIRFTKKRVIENSLIVMQADPTISQVLLKKY